MLLEIVVLAKISNSVVYIHELEALASRLDTRTNAPTLNMLRAVAMPLHGCFDKAKECAAEESLTSASASSDGKRPPVVE